MYLELINGEVQITEEGKQLTVYKELDSNDRHTGKPWVKACITFAFWMHKKNGPFSNMLPQQRAERVCNEILQGKYKPVQFEVNYEYGRFAKDYITSQYSMTEQLHESIKKDIEELLSRIKEIPFTKKQRIKATVKIPDPDGVIIDRQVDTVIDIDNSEEKYKAIALAEKLVDYEQKIRQKIMAETKEKRRSSSKRIFEEDNEIVH